MCLTAWRRTGWSMVTSWGRRSISQYVRCALSWGLALKCRPAPSRKLAANTGSGTRWCCGVVVAYHLEPSGTCAAQADGGVKKTILVTGEGWEKPETHDRVTGASSKAVTMGLSGTPAICMLSCVHTAASAHATCSSFPDKGPVHKLTLAKLLTLAKWCAL